MPQAPAGALSKPAEAGLRFERAGEDLAVRPQDNLFLAANGGWLSVTSIPADKPSWGNFAALDEQASKRVLAIVESLSQGQPAAGSIERKIADFHRAFMDEAALDAAGLKPIQPWLDRIASVRSSSDLARLLGEWQGMVALPLSLDVQPDQKQPSVNLALTWQGGLGLPNREYYLSKDAGMVKARGAYLGYLVKLFVQLGADETLASRQAAQVMALETRLAKAQWTEVDNRDPQKTWNPLPTQALASQAPGLDWPAFFSAAAMPGPSRLNLSQPSYARELALAVRQVPLAQWKLYLQARLLDGQANVLSQPLRSARFEFNGRALLGMQAPLPRWQQGMDAINAALGEALGQVYVARHFPPANQQRMQQLVGWLMQAYGDSIRQLAWMSPTTREKASEKLAKYNAKIGYPSRWRDYSALEIRPADPVGNNLRAGRFEHERVAAKLGHPVDRSEWYLTPQTVNAYYNPALNEVVFPAAILEPPFFDMQADDAANFGAIGAIIGHEISHGFDDQGSQYDGDGRLENWWTPQDRKAFDALAARLVVQYSAYEPLPGHRLNGKLTLGENLADLSGAEIAYKAWKLSLGGKPAPVINGLTGEQRFFYSFAHVWRSKLRDELRLKLVTADPHSPEQFRVNGTVVNLDGFHEAFGTKLGDGLFKPAEERLKIW